MAFWLVAMGLPLLPVFFIARLSWRARRRTALAIVTGLAGALAGFFGLLALAFHGYVEDSGSTPDDTLGLSAALLLESAVLYALAWSVAARRPARFPVAVAVIAVVGAGGCVDLLAGRF